MKTYAAVITYVDNMVERRAPYRPAHLERLEKLHQEGVVPLAGAWADPIDGALILLRAESLEDARAILEADPYNQAGLWTGYTLREWNVVIGTIE